MAIITGDFLNNVLLGTPFADTISGLGGVDLLMGFGGDDFLNGGTGADVMLGGLGNDTYLVDNVGDIVFEDPGAGIDTVNSLISFSLNTSARANIENLTLVGGAVFGVGNALANRIIGNNLSNTLLGLDGNDALFGGLGNNSLNGGTGVDNMQGGAGNDLYFADTNSDFVFEGVGAGIDRIISTASFTLNTAVRANVEDLTLSASAFTGIGNALGNTITGTNLNNNLQGLGGNDTILGLGGNDFLAGGTGADLLDGGLGADTMNGGGFGNDSFRFASALGTVDVIQDFSPSFFGNNDSILLDDDVFLGVGPVGVLPGFAFRDGAFATTPFHRVIYNEVTGQVFFDRDGSGALPQVQFATLIGSPNDVTNFDFIVVA